MYFYLPQIQKVSELDSNQTFFIHSDYIQHFISMRVQPGQVIEVTDLQGVLAKIKITQANYKKREISFQIVDKLKASKSSKLVLYQAILEKNYMEKLVEVVATTGYTDIVFFNTKNSVKQKINLERLKLILQRSCSQSQNLFMPEIHIYSFEQLIQEAQNHLKTNLVSSLILMDKAGESICEISKKFSKSQIGGFLVGPEGGFDKAEIKIFEDLAVPKLSLTNLVLPAWLAGCSGFWNYNQR